MEELMTVEAAAKLRASVVVGSGQVDGFGYDVVADESGARRVVGSRDALEAMSLVYDAVDNMHWDGE